MPNWDRTPPKNRMSIEEMKRRVEDGIRRRRQRGELRPITKAIPTHREGPGFDKPQRRALVAACNLAIYSLVKMDRTDYCAAIDAINGLRRQAGIDKRFMTTICHGIASEAAELAGAPVADLNYLARTWLAAHYAPSTRVISIPKPKDNKHENRTEGSHGKVH